MTHEPFAQTLNRLKGNVPMIFITDQVPKGLQVDEGVNMGAACHAHEFGKGGYVSSRPSKVEPSGWPLLKKVIGAILGGLLLTAAIPVLGYLVRRDQARTIDCPLSGTA